jgi:hypothetical protein
MAGLQILVDGEWHDVGEARDITFTAPEPDPADEERVEISTRQTWSMPVTFEDPEAFRDLIARLEREARAARWRARWWLTSPYRLRGSHV